MAEYKVGVTLGLADGLSGKLNAINEKWKAFQQNTKVAAEDVQWFNDSWSRVKTGTAVAGVGMAMLGVSAAMVKARMESEKLESNIQSLGVTASEVSSISAFGTGLAAEMGVAKETFLTGVYDLKSGISSLNAADMGAFAGAVAQTATATKGDFAQLSKLFAQTYQTYRGMYGNMSDLDMGNLIGNTLSLAVQKYRTDGAAMQQAMTSLGSTGAALKISLTEQAAVLGTLQNKMDPGSAGTAYRAFLAKAGTGLQSLGISATDATGKLKSMPDILSSLRDKFGENIDATKELPALYQAFGEEGAKTVLNLLPHVDALRGDISELGATVENRDWSALKKMSDTNLDNLVGTTARLKEGFNALFADAGGPMASALNTLLQPLASVVGWVAKLGTEHPNIAKIVGVTFTLVAVVVTLTGVVMAAQGALNMFRIMNYYSALAQTANTSASSAAVIGQSILQAKTWITIGATQAWAAAQWLVNAAMTANPIGLIIVGVAALIGGIYLLVKNWESVTGLFDSLKTKWNAMPNWVKGLVVLLLLPLLPFIGIPLLIYKNWDTIKEIPGKVFAFWNKLPGWAQFLLAGLMPIIGIPLLIYKNWDRLKALAAMVPGWLAGLKESFLTALSDLGNTSGGMLMKTLARGIVAGGKWVIGAIVEVLGGLGSFFNMSDAKRGPLAKTTQFGSNLPKTYASGIDKGASAVTPSVQRFAQKAAGALSVPLKPLDAASAGGAARGQKGFTLNFKNLIGELNLEGGSSKGSLDELSRKIAQVLFREMEKYEAVTL
jgi:TP901 family phage tail tape measure protein